EERINKNINEIRIEVNTRFDKIENIQQEQGKEINAIKTRIDRIETRIDKIEAKLETVIKLNNLKS
ncbi:MAG: hypothetical protein LBD05_00265, partial [Mycoplasmataceae bacterium]|nr:hypothetical protein [Mycoplasmataceae bacterium]